MAYLSKLKLANGSVYDLKDAVSRAALMELLGLTTEAELAAWTGELGTAAWKAVETTLTDGDNLPTGAAVKAYVDSQIEDLNTFDIVIDNAGTSAGPSVTASADTMYKMYLVPDEAASAGTYIEWVTIRQGTAGSYTYHWEKIGSTQADLTGFVSNTTQIAGIQIGDGISKAQLQAALDLASMAYADTASGDVQQQVMTGVTGTVTPTGTVEVTLGFDSTSLSSTGSYTPAGSITLTTTPTEVMSDVTFSKSNASGAVQIEGEVSAPTFTVTPTTGSAVSSVTFVAPTKAADSFTAASMTNTTTTVTTEGLVAAIDSTDTEMLVFSTAATSTASHITNFDGGSFTEGSFTAGSLTAPTTSVVTGISSATATTPTFSGASYIVNGTQGSIDVPSAATFTGTAANVTVTGNYDKAKVNTQTFTGTASTVTINEFTVPGSTVTVTPD